MRRVLAVQLAIVTGVLALWGWLPPIPGARTVVPVMDPFVISSPSRVVVEIGRLATGAHQTPLIWPYLWTTLIATAIGTASGLVLGAVAGLLLSNNDFADRVLRPFIVA